MKTTGRTLLAEGKTKKIWEATKNTVIIESKDAITAGDGARRDQLPNKGVWATTTTCNCFELLNKCGIPTHFLSQLSPTEFLAQRVEMIPIEIVARRVSAGSYPKRHPDVQEGKRFNYLVVEHFDKNDAEHDPLISYDFLHGTITHYDPSEPPSQASAISQYRMENPAEIKARNVWLDDVVRRTFSVLEAAWLALDIWLIDFKIECGYRSGTEEIVVADVIDNDSWRIWPEGKKSKMLDKQVYRDLHEATPQALLDLAANYATVANATKTFCS